MSTWIIRTTQPKITSFSFSSLFCFFCFTCLFFFLSCLFVVSHSQTTNKTISNGRERSRCYPRLVSSGPDTVKFCTLQGQILKALLLLELHKLTLSLPGVINNYVISPYIINTLSTRQVTIIKKIINYL